MSYCRFENTVNDMQDCLNAIEDREVNDLSDYEVKALQHFLELGRVIVDYEDDIEEIFEEGTEEQVIEAWQHLHDTGLAYKLQGWFGRTAQSLIEQGVINE
jgi:hypothetical protein